MDYKDTCNRRINCLVYANGVICGAMGINNSILSLGARDKYIGWSKEQRLSNLRHTANNYRFALMVTGMGGKILGRFEKVAQLLWFNKYGDKLVMLESLVKPPWAGTVYKSCNWIEVGMTKGVSFSKAPLASWRKENSSRGKLARENPELAIQKYAVGGKHYKITTSEPKHIFIKPLTKDWRDILCVK